jgi:ankyrin repeat protein
MLEAGAQVNTTNSDGNTALYWSAYEGHSDAVKLLLENGADPNIRFISGRTVLSPVCMQGYNDILKLLLEAGAQPIYTCHAAGETPLMIAVYNGRYDCVKMLLAAQADPNARDHKGNTALRFAQQLEQNEIHGLLVRYGAVL